MSLQQNFQTPEKTLLTLRIVAVALILSLANYVVVLIILRDTVSQIAQPQALDFMKYVLAGMSAVLAPACLLVKSMMLVPEKALGAVFKNVSGSDPPDLDSAKLTMQKRFFTAHIIPLVLAEAIGVWGVVIFMLTGDQAYAYGLIGLSFIVQVIMFPRKALLDELLSRLERAHGSGAWIG